jgi:sugar/nucleoside kinase (ribokinase family)
MQTYDLALYGHITIDQMINEKFEKSYSLGAMANVWSALKEVDSNLSVDLNPTAIGEAIILINEKQGVRLGRGNLNLRTCENISLSNAGWHHVMYINKLKNTDFVKDINGTVSADITSGPIKDLEILKYIDYLFISDEDLSVSLEDLVKNVKGFVVLHYPAGSIIANGEKEIKSSTKVIENLNVLGAGDTFAACFIDHKIQNPSATLEENAKYAHLMTEKILVSRRDNE